MKENFHVQANIYEVLLSDWKFVLMIECRITEEGPRNRKGVADDF